jgi:hypothetical protein
LTPALEVWENRSAGRCTSKPPNPEFVGLTAGANHIFVVGPARLADLAAHDIDLTLDALERRECRIIEDGDPQLVWPQMRRDS